MLSHASQLRPGARLKIVSPGLASVTMHSQHCAGTSEGQILAQIFCLVQMQPGHPLCFPQRKVVSWLCVIDTEKDQPWICRCGTGWGSSIAPQRF